MLVKNFLERAIPTLQTFLEEFNILGIFIGAVGIYTLIAGKNFKLLKSMFILIIITFTFTVWFQDHAARHFLLPVYTVWVLFIQIGISTFLKGKLWNLTK